jgi:preprotein translocase subunit SecG
MQIWLTLLLALQVITAIVMIGLVLVQHGKGADMGASFGSGASGSLFGASGSANFLSRSTAACATVFFLCTLAITYLSSTGNVTRSKPGASVLDAPLPAASAPGVGAIPAAPTLPAAPAPGQIPAPPAGPAASR